MTASASRPSAFSILRGTLPGAKRNERLSGMSAPFALFDRSALAPLRIRNGAPSGPRAGPDRLRVSAHDLHYYGTRADLVAGLRVHLVHAEHGRNLARCQRLPQFLRIN